MHEPSSIDARAKIAPDLSAASGVDALRAGTETRDPLDDVHAREARLRADIGSALTREPVLRAALQRSAEAIVAHVDAAFARIWLLGDDAQVLQLEASAGLYTHIDGGHARVPVGALKIGSIASRREPHLTNDVQHDPRVGNHEWARREGLVSFAGYPLLVDERLVGVAALFARVPLADSTLHVLSAVADLIALAIDRSRSQERLLASEARHRLFAEATNEGIWCWNIRTGSVDWNARFLEILGVGRGEWGGTFDDFLARVHPEDRPRMQEALHQHLEHDSPYDVSFRLRHASGDYRHCIARGKAMRDASGRALLMAGGVSDNTPKVKAEQALAVARAFAEAQRNSMYATFMQAPAAIAIMTGAPGELTFELTNPLYEQIVGRTGLAGRKGREALPELVEQRLWDLVDRVVASGEPWSANELPAKIRRAADGALEERYFNSTIQPTLGEDGRVNGAVSFSVDVSAQVHARELLREREAQLRQLVENLPELAWSALPDGHIDYYNRRWYDYTGTTVEEMQGSGWKIVHDPAMLDGVLDRWGHAIAAGEPFETEFPLRGADGVYQWFLTRVNPLRDASGRIVRWFGTSTNIEVRKRTEEERERLIGALAATNAELDQFAYVASHDLKAPLRGIANLSQWVEEDLGEKMTAECRTNMELLRGRVHRLEKLIDGILSYSRAGRVREKLEEIATGPLLAEVIELLGVVPPASVQVVGAMPIVIAERVPLQQVLLNLISNALKHGGKPDVRVAISSCDAGNAWQVTVRDDGVGIAPAFHDRVWGIFQTLQPRDRVEGTGIGLSVVKKIIESRGGRVWIESDEGQGAAFHFTWPKRVRRES